MYFSDRIKLQTIVKTLTSGSYVSTVTSEKEVWADRQSVKWGEFYSALTAGRTVDIVFVVNKDDYSDQTQISFDSKTYEVQRPYWSEKDPDHYYLTCRRLT